VFLTGSLDLWDHIDGLFDRIVSGLTDLYGYDTVYNRKLIIVTALGRASPRHLISSRLVSNYE
jgi:hypothetical protein